MLEKTSTAVAPNELSCLMEKRRRP
jgi:hypothetical protein